MLDRLLLFVLAGLVRLLPWPSVFYDGSVYPAGSDAYYHLRRIWYSVVNHLELLHRDAYVAFPFGGEPIWSPALDRVLALATYATLGADDQHAVERALVFVPPLLGGLTAVLLYGVARRHFSRGVALAAGAFLAVLPASFFYSQLGFVDHHVAVALVTTWLLGSAMSYVAVPASETSANATRFARERRSAVLGLAMGTSLLIWPGCLVHVGALELALVVHLLATGNRDRAVERARGFALAHALAFLVVAPACLGRSWAHWGGISPVVLSGFQPLFLATAALLALVLALVWTRVWFPTDAFDRVGSTLAAGGATVGALLLAAPALGEGALDAWLWLSRSESFQARVAESQPLFWIGGEFGFEAPQQLLTRLVFLTPVAIALLAWHGRGRRMPPERALLLAWTSILAAATVAQVRFANSFSVAFAFLVAWAASELLSTFAGRIPRRRGVRLALGAVATLVVFALVSPVLESYVPHASNLLRALRGEPTLYLGVTPHHPALVRVARWLAANTPQTSGYLDASEQPEYGVLAAWGDGHVIRYVAERPLVQDNFGDDVGGEGFELSERYFASQSESQAAAILERLGVRYVVVRESGSGHGRRYAPRSMFARLYLTPGSGSSGLTRHRLIYDAPAWIDATGRETRYRVYELTPVSVDPTSSASERQSDMKVESSRR